MHWTGGARGHCQPGAALGSAEGCQALLPALYLTLVSPVKHCSAAAGVVRVFRQWHLVARDCHHRELRASAQQTQPLPHVLDPQSGH